MSRKGGKLVALGGIAALLAHFWPRGGQEGERVLSWWPQFGGGGGDTPAGDVDISITADTPEGEDALNTPVTRDPNLPRGIRNANPGNLRLSGTPWRGKSDAQTDGAFVQFDEPVYGIRALARTLQTYRNSYGGDTVREIIDRWAPPNENNTQAYVNAVADAMGVGPDDEFPATEANTMALVKSIIQHENGRQPYPDDLILQGIRLA